MPSPTGAKCASLMESGFLIHKRIRNGSVSVKEEKSFALVRTETFSDGVLAVIITVMALELKVPEVVGTFQPHALVALVPKLASYAMAFVLVGVSWVQHVLSLRDVPRATMKLFWHNLLFLFCASLIPFTTAFLGEHPSLPVAVAMWSTAAGLTVFTGQLLYGAAHAGRPYDLWSKRRSAFSVLAALTAIGMAFVSVYVAWVLLLLGFVAVVIPVAYVKRLFSPTRVRAAPEMALVAPPEPVSTDATVNAEASPVMTSRPVPSDHGVA